LLIIATVYQRYHYVVDLFAGALFAMVCVYTAPRLYQYLHDNVQTRDRLHPWTPKDR
jgi:membrane-associated phospholipid phosphatase